MFLSRYLPCPECGDSVPRDAHDAHACDPRRRAEYIMFGLREEIAAFEATYEAYTRSPAGRFEAWLAARDVRRTA